MAARTVLGLAALLIVLAIALFAPAGTLGYWQGWVYLAVFCVCSGLITVYLWQRDPALLQRRLNAGPTSEQRTTQKLIQSAASLAFVAVLIVSGLDQRFGWSSVPSLFTIAADILVALGFIAVFFVFRENTFTAATIEVVSDQTVISSGPYAYVRHPMYAGAMLLMFATPVALACWWAELPVALLALVIVLRLLDEERFLDANLPGYTEYRARVRWRLIPRFW